MDQDIGVVQRKVDGILSRTCSLQAWFTWKMALKQCACNNVDKDNCGIVFLVKPTCIPHFVLSRQF